ncbi:MAG: hypothetical protein J7J65_02670 [Candidatus Korarchaeota archaeon]|nr:hypothetical protein [Candidatus Korarchaeota archaeon]
MSHQLELAKILVVETLRLTLVEMILSIELGTQVLKCLAIQQLLSVVKS